MQIHTLLQTISIMLSICYMTWPLLWSEHLREFNTTNNKMRLPSASRARSNSDALKTPVPSSSRIMNACCRTHRKLTQVHVYRYTTFPINFMHKLKLCQHKNLNKQCKTRSRQRHNMSVKVLLTCCKTARKITHEKDCNGEHSRRSFKVNGILLFCWPHITSY